MKEYLDNIDDAFNSVAGMVIRKYREEKGLSLEEVVNKMNQPVTRQSLYKYENNKARMKVNVFVDICKAIGEDPNELWKEINSATLYVNLSKNKNENKKVLQRISPDNELTLLLNENTNILTDSDKRIIKTIIEERKKENGKD